MSISNPIGCKPSMPCNFSLDLMNPLFVATVGYFAGKNTTILDYSGSIMFTFFAVNGAGNGNAASFSYTVSKETQAG